MWNNSLRELWNISLRSMWNEICPHSRQRIFHICGANISQQSYFTCLKGKFRWKKPNAIALGFFLAGAGGLGLVATTQSRVFDFGFAMRLRSSAALTVHRTVIHYRSPSSPLQIVSQQKEKAHEKRGLYLFGRGGRTRTRDPRFWRPVLYQLSYTPMHPYIILNFFRFVKCFLKKFFLSWLFCLPSGFAAFSAVI